MLQNKGPLQLPDDGKAAPAGKQASLRGEAGNSGSKNESRPRGSSINDTQKSIWSILDGNLGLINE